MYEFFSRRFMFTRLENMPPRIAFATTNASRSLTECGTPGRTIWICDCAPGRSTNTTRLSVAAFAGVFGGLRVTAPGLPFHAPNAASSFGRSAAGVTSPATMSAAFFGAKSRS
ncbi:MAG: hypothetical protein KIS78_28210 [Labilithrix sp.]|nr:hypothetical protein [Labilithrix sp.]